MKKPKAIQTLVSFMRANKKYSFKRKAQHQDVQNEYATHAKGERQSKGIDRKYCQWQHLVLHDRDIGYQIF